MKLRLDFVTNSSSTSYVCNICNYALDNNYNFWFIGCEKGHLFCLNHLKEEELLSHLNEVVDRYMVKANKKDLEQLKEFKKNINKPTADIYLMIDMLIVLKEDGLITDLDPMPSKYCPICNLRVIDSDKMLDYLCIKNNIDLDKLTSEIRSKFKNDSDLINYLEEELI